MGFAVGGIAVIRLAVILTLLTAITAQAWTQEMLMRKAYGVRGAAVSAWTPSQASPSAWYAPDSFTVTASNTISQWSDKMGNSARLLFQSTGSAQPVYSNSAAWFNNSTTVISSTNPFCYAAGSMTLLFVAKGTNTLTGTTAPSIFSETSTAANNPVYAVDISRADIVRDGMRVFLRNDAGSYIDGTIGEGKYGAGGVFVNSVKLCSIYDSGSSYTNHVDGTNYLAFAYTRTGSFTLDRMSLGGWQRAALALPFNGFIYEVIISAPAMTESNRLKCEGYLAWKYSLQGNLPADHPYKASAP
jgi:hypothetical protein